jgi:hypothetical protein
MRAYALALGTLLTIGSGCVADLAVASTARGPGRSASAPAPATLLPTTPALPNAVWCGGTLAPVVVEARGVARAARPTITLAGQEPAIKALVCRARNQSGDRVI